MEMSELLALFDREQRRDVEYGGARREVTADVVRHVIDAGPRRTGFVTYSCLGPGDADRVIDDQIAYFAQLGVQFEWKLYGHDTPEDLGARLSAHGLEREDHESVMVLDLNEAPDSLWRRQSHDVRRITDPDLLADVVAVENEAWGTSFDWIACELAQQLAEPGEPTCVYVAYLESAPVSAAWVRFHPPTSFASLWGGSTVAACRRRGFYTALLAARCCEARRRGVRFLTVDAGEMSRPILEKHGFASLTTATAYKWRPAPS